jgi:hypothetical protein
MKATPSDCNDYCLEVNGVADLLAAAERIFDLVWRTDFSAAGFAAATAAGVIDSQTLRSWMLALQRRLSSISEKRGFGRFGIRSLGRFDQQETTMFHLDGAPERSLLVLGYEPTNVESRLFLADYSRAAFDKQTTPRQFLDDFNPMYKQGEEALAPYVAELPRQPENRSRIVLINNSSLPFDEKANHPLGVLHKAIIVAPDPSSRRIVNSMMLAGGAADDASEQAQQDFVTTTAISQRIYTSPG